MDKITRQPTEMVIAETEEELKHRKTFANVDLLAKYKDSLKCTKCALNYSKKIARGEDFGIHPLLKVFFCKSCKDFYEDGDFSLDEGEDKYCRWCGEGGTVYLCSDCIYGFCPTCIKNNLGMKVLRNVQNDDNWKCFFCIPEPLWHLRLLTAEALRISKENEGKVESDSRKKRVRNKRRISSDSNESDGVAKKAKEADCDQEAKNDESSEKVEGKKKRNAENKKKSKPGEEPTSSAANESEIDRDSEKAVAENGMSTALIAKAMKTLDAVQIAAKIVWNICQKELAKTRPLNLETEICKVTKLASVMASCLNTLDNFSKDSSDDDDGSRDVRKNVKNLYHACGFMGYILAKKLKKRMDALTPDSMPLCRQKVKELTEKLKPLVAQLQEQVNNIENIPDNE